MRSQSTRVRGLWLSRPCGAVLVAACVLGTSLTSAAEPPQEAGPESAVDLASIERRVRSAYETVAPAVVRIESKSRVSENGVIVTADGHVLSLCFGSAWGGGESRKVFL